MEAAARGCSNVQRVFNRALFDAANEALLAIYSEASRVMVPFVSLHCGSDMCTNL